MRPRRFRRTRGINTFLDGWILIITNRPVFYNFYQHLDIKVRHMSSWWKTETNLLYMDNIMTSKARSKGDSIHNFDRGLWFPGTTRSVHQKLDMMILTLQGVSTCYVIITISAWMHMVPKCSVCLQFLGVFSLVRLGRVSSCISVYDSINQPRTCKYVLPLVCCLWIQSDVLANDVNHIVSTINFGFEPHYQLWTVWLACG